MIEPSLNRETRVLAQARRGLAPGAAQRQATLARLGAALALAPGLAAASSPAFSQPESAFGAAKPAALFSLRALVAGVVSGVLVGFGAGYVASSHSSEQRSEAHSSVPSNTRRASATPSPSTAHSVPASNGALSPPPPASEPGVSRSAASASGSLRDRLRRDAKAPALAPAADYDELSYIQRAQAALRNGDAALALGLMRSLDELQPKGALLAERRVLRVLALCELGRADEARAVATGAVKSGNTSEVYRRRLERSCVGHLNEASSE